MRKEEKEERKIVNKERKIEGSKFIEYRRTATICSQ